MTTATITITTWQRPGGKFDAEISLLPPEAGPYIAGLDSPEKAHSRAVARARAWAKKRGINPLFDATTRDGRWVKLAS